MQGAQRKAVPVEVLCRRAADAEDARKVSALGSHHNARNGHRIGEEVQRVVRQYTDHIKQGVARSSRLGTFGFEIT